MRIEILCPVCAKRGYRKTLLLAEDDLKGKLYPYCPWCKKEVEIDFK